MQSSDIRKQILGIFKQKDAFEDIHEDQDYFDLGVSSLTIIELQIKVEEALGVEISTADLMRLATINEWVELYSNEFSKTALQSA